MTLQSFNIRGWKWLSAYNQLTAPEGLFKDIHFALVDSSHKDEIEKSLTDQYLTEYPEYENIFQVYWVKQNNGARFVQ